MVGEAPGLMALTLTKRTKWTVKATSKPGDQFFEGLTTELIDISTIHKGQLQTDLLISDAFFAGDEHLYHDE